VHGSIEVCSTGADMRKVVVENRGNGASGGSSGLEVVNGAIRCAVAPSTYPKKRKRAIGRDLYGFLERRGGFAERGCLNDWLGVR
jgi:hypothetical protein